ncbi:hypothetical protein [uncultured Desulfovibrio sp.]|uniref:hypothetical protein n=1 Tax=uncultured Desulfovibrio sp. TaxID=167968 RepID=UPI0025910455|nr:hypothetical protein [uncultured Desulfovibrio sp.]
MRNAVSLGSTLTTDLLTPLMAYAEMIKQGGAYAQSRLLWALIEDADRKLMQVFEQINEQAPNVQVRLPSLD